MKKTSDIGMKDRIIEESIKLFLKKSFRSTTIEDITDACNITKGAFYWHFESKNQLLNTIIDQFDTLFLDEWIRTLHDIDVDASFLRKFKLSHKFLSEFALQHKGLCVGFVTLCAEFAGNQTATEQKIRGVYEKFVSVFREIIEGMKKEGILREDGIDPGIAAHVIVGAYNGLLLEWYMHSNEVDSRRLVRTYLDICLNGMLKNN